MSRSSQQRTHAPGRPVSPVASRSLVSTLLGWPLGFTAVGATSLAVAPMTTSEGPTAALGGAAIGCGLVTGVEAFRRRHRAGLLSALARSLTPQIGPPGSANVTVRRWSGGWSGVPKKIRITYDPVAASSDPKWIPAILETCTRRLQREYEVVAHKPRPRLLTLRLLPTMSEKVPTPALLERSQDITKQLLGDECTLNATWDGDHLQALDIRHKAGIRVAHGVVRARIERTVTTMLPGRWRAQWDLERDRVRFELRPVISGRVDHPVVPVDFDDPDSLHRLPYAVDEDGHTLYWSLRSGASSPHFLCMGSTGTGKTVMLNGLIMEVVRRGWRVWICDPKRIEFVGLRGWPNVQIVATDVADIVAVIQSAWQEMERRYQLIESGKASDGDDFERLFLVLDEYRYFYGVVNAWYSGLKRPPKTPTKCPIMEKVFLIASLGRSAGVHLVLGTQRPDADWLGGDVRDQFTARASLGRLSPEGARMTWGAHHIGVAVPRGIPGRGTTVGVDGFPVESQAFWTPDPRRLGSDDRDRAILEGLRPDDVAHERLVVVPPDPELDEDCEPDESKMEYPAFANAPMRPLRLHPELEAHAVTLEPDTRPRHSAAAMALTGDAAPEEPVDTGGHADAYGEPVMARPDDLQPGDLVCIDEETDAWGVVESAEPDVTDSSSVCICWRSDEAGDDFDVIVAPSSQSLRARRRVDE